MRFKWERTIVDEVDTATCRDVAAAEYLADRQFTTCHEMKDRIEAWHWLASFSGPAKLVLAASSLRKSIEAEIAWRYRDYRQTFLEDGDSPQVQRQKKINILAAEALTDYETRLAFGSPPVTALATDPKALFGRVAARITDYVRERPELRFGIQDADRPALAGIVAQEYQPVATKPVAAPHIPVAAIEDWELAAVEEAERFKAMSPLEIAALEQACTIEVLALLSELDKPMAGYSWAVRALLARLRRGEELHAVERYGTTYADTRARMRAVVIDRSLLTPARAADWATTLAADGFNVDGLRSTMAGLEQTRTDTTASLGECAAACNQLNGYNFQVFMTLQAWQEYRLVEVEHLLKDVNRRIDTIEYVGSAGEVRYREYKAYNPNGQPGDKERTAFHSQFQDYTKALAGSGSVEYVFQHGCPQWARDILTTGAPYFKHGLWLTDVLADRSEQLADHMEV